MEESAVIENHQEAESVLPEATKPRTRRAMLSAMLGGLAGLFAGRLARPDAAVAVAGSPLIVGETNTAGSATTGLAANSAATVLAINQTGTNLTGSNGIRSDASYGTGGVFTSSFNTALLAIASDPAQNAI